MNKYRNVINTTAVIAIVVFVACVWSTHVNMAWYGYIAIGILLASGLRALENFINRKLWKVQDE